MASKGIDPEIWLMAHKLISDIGNCAEADIDSLARAFQDAFEDAANALCEDDPCS
jgi:hypothetical protein